MTIENTDRLVVYTGNGVTTEFPYEFLIPDASAAVVSLYDVATNALIEEIDPADYIIDGLGEATGGTVTYNPVDGPISSSVKIVIERQQAYTQTLAIPNQASFFPEEVERAFDRVVMQTQQLAEQLARTITLPPTATATSIEEFTAGVLALTEISDEIIAVAGISAEIVAVDEKLTEIDGVYSQLIALSGVYANLAAILAVNANEANIDTVADDLTGVNTIGTVATNITDVQTVAGIDSDVSTVAANDTNITIVAGIAADISTLVPISIQIQALALIDDAIATVAGISTEVVAVANNEANINAVAAELPNIASKLNADGSNATDRTKWRLRAIGEIVYVDTSLTGVEVPPVDAGFIELSAGLDGASEYNEGKLISETITGSGATIVATAVIDDADSPMNGETIHLINTEERVRYSGERAKAGSVFNDQMQQITGTVQLGGAVLGDSTGALTNVGSPSRATAASGGQTDTISLDTANSPNARTGDRTLAKGQFMVAYLKYKDVA